MSDNSSRPVTTTTTTTSSVTGPEEEVKSAKVGGGGELEEEGGGGVREEEEVQGAEGSLRGRRKLENADSSYDSDFDPREDESHGDVCRTVSDTLGAEFAEYVTKYSPHTPTHSSSTSSHSTVTPQTLPSTSLTSSSSSVQSQPLLKSTTTTTTGDTTPTATTTAASTTTTTTAASTTTVTTSTITPTSVQTTTTATGKDDGSALPTTTTTTTTASTSPPTPTTTTTTATTKDAAPTTTPTTTPPTLTLTQPHLAPKTESESRVTRRTTETGGESARPGTFATSVTTTTTTSTTTTTATAATTTATTTTTLHQRPSYASQVEFGIKLGYSEALVQLALIKLGATPDKDDLLAELIRLGTTNLPRTDAGGGGGGSGGGGGGGSEGEDREEIFLASSSSSSSSSTTTIGLHQHHLHHLGQLPHLHHIHLQQEQQQQQQQQQTQTQHQSTALRPIIIDGSNVAMSHGNKSTFSCRGLRVCVEWFRARGHREITVFVPAWRKEAPRWDTPIADQEVLLELERESVLVFTPSRVCGGKRIVSYDDRYILKEAVQSGGVVVSNDNYRDLVSESPGFRRVVEEKLLMYSWVNGRFVPPDDPLGRSGPTLDVFLRRSSLRDKDKQAPCPYGRKCTYGNKCKYKHPERGTAPLKSVTEGLREEAQRHYQNKAKSRDSSPGEGLRGSLSLPVCAAEPDVCKKPLTRTQSIVPTVSLTLPSALTQDTPTHDHSPATTPATPAPSHHHLMPPPLDPLRSATLYKSDSALYHLYPTQPAPGPPGYGSSAWGWEGGQQGGGAGHYGSHLPLAKQQSDPDQQDNPHRKLQRQLTLNPSYDSRLYKIHGFREPAPEHFPLGAASSPGTGPSPGQSQGQGSPSRVGRGTEAAVFPPGQGRASPGYSSGPYAGREQVHGGLHPPLARYSSQDGGKHLASLPPHLNPSYSHPHVTRFASAPDPIWGGPHQPAAAATPPLITRLNSTSDTRLNLYAADSHYFPDVYEDPLGRSASYAPMPHPPGPSQGPGPIAPAPGPVGSRPMSPQSTALHHSPSVSPRGHTPPQQQAPGSAPPQGAPAGSFPPPGHEDTRLRVFYHLSQLFPEAQVRAVMTQHPEETNPQKICSYILAAAAAAAGQGGSRPMSPQHQTPAPPPQPPASPYLLQAFPGSPLAAPPASHEDARLRAFYHLSQLFPEAEVRAVLARAPDETDIQQFCAALLARRATQQS